jgi:hypothetical protein
MTAIDRSMTQILRKHQETDPMLGPLFRSLHLFADRTVEQFFKDTPDLPKPVISLERDSKHRHGYFTERDGYALAYRINLNPFSLRTGAEAAEILAHEMIHLWQAHIGRPCVRNYHSAEFHAQMASRYGIITTGKNGEHGGYLINPDTSVGIWEIWMESNSDLRLHEMILPGMDQKPRRQLLKHLCPGCNATFRARKPLSAVCMDCDVPFEVVNG